MGKLYKIYSSGSTILAEVLKKIGDAEDKRIAVLEALTEIFEGVKLMPTDTTYIPNKYVRFVMMMVRPRPIGTGIWSETEPDVFSPLQTFIPLNNELVKVIADNEILENPNMTWEFGNSLVEYFSEIFPDDPSRGYFSLIGLKDYSPNK